MSNLRVRMATVAILCAVLGGTVVWSIMTYTLINRHELEQLQDTKQELAECQTERTTAVQEVITTKAQALAGK